jgi:hypothetical protein
MPKCLTHAQIEQYREEGCVFPIRIMSETEPAPRAQVRCGARRACSTPIPRVFDDSLYLEIDADGAQVCPGRLRLQCMICHSEQLTALSFVGLPKRRIIVLRDFDGCYPHSPSPRVTIAQ